jgi:mRNA-degrading endonuclease RelE of RelBE toxin-antitoxin system
VAFAILLHPKAAKELERLEEDLRTRIKERLRDLKNNPESIGKALKPSDFWSLRIGDYRATFEIDRAKKQVIVLFIGHRKKVSDDLSKML